MGSRGLSPRGLIDRNIDVSFVMSPITIRRIVLTRGAMVVL